MSCGVGHRRGLDPTLLWLWHSLAATTLIRPLAWEPPYAARAAQEMAKNKTKQKKKQRPLMVWLGTVSKARMVMGISFITVALSPMN